MGRRMNGSETFTAYLSSGVRLCCRRRRPEVFRRHCRHRGVAQADLGTILQFVLAIDHNALAGLEALVNQGLALVDQAHFDRPHFNRLILFDNKRKRGQRSFRPALNHLGRHHHAVLANVKQQPGVDKLAGPQAQVRIGKSRFDLDRRGRDIDLVINDGQFAFAQRGCVVLSHRQHGQFRPRNGHLRLDLRQ